MIALALLWFATGVIAGGYATIKIIAWSVSVNTQTRRTMRRILDECDDREKDADP